MKKIFLLIVLASMAVASLNSCQRNCRCYHYNGSIKEYTLEELEELGYTCNDMTSFNLGLTYSLCEKTF